MQWRYEWPFEGGSNAGDVSRFRRGVLPLSSAPCMNVREQSETSFNLGGTAYQLIRPKCPLDTWDFLFAIPNKGGNGMKQMLDRRWRCWRINGRKAR